MHKPLRGVYRIFDLLKGWNLVDRSVLKIPTSLLSSLAAMLSKLVFKGYPVPKREQVTGRGSRSRAGVFHLMYPHLYLFRSNPVPMILYNSPICCSPIGRAMGALFLRHLAVSANPPCYRVSEAPQLLIGYV